MSKLQNQKPPQKPKSFVLESTLISTNTYHRGNHTALNVLRVPTVEEEQQREEQQRARGRLRESIKKEVQRNAQRGRGLALI